jgi:PAS domain S-box-containing protein
MASLQAYQSHGIQYYRIVESFRNHGKPSIRVLAHLGRVDDILQRHQQQQKEVPVRVSSVSAGAVTAIHHLTLELDLAGRINRAIAPDEEVQVRDALTVGESLVAAMIGRACAPRSKRAFADWAKTTHLPDLMRFTSADLTSQHFWDQMNAVPVEKLAGIEQELVREVVRIEQLQLQALAYDTTNFYTHIASTNLRAKLPQRGKNKQGRHDLRQMGLALVVDQVTQLPLAHVLYEGARSDMKTFVEFLKPVRKRLRELTGQPDQLTLIFDAGASSRQNLEGLERYVTAVRPSDHRALLSEAGGHRWHGTIVDMHDWKKAEEKIRQSEKEARQLLDLSPLHITELGAEGARLYTNLASLDYYGMTLAEWRDADLQKVLHSLDAAIVTKDLPGKLQNGSPFEYESRLKRKDGQYRWFHYRLSPMLDEQGRITRWYAAGTDIDDRKLAEQRLQEENVSLREEIDSLAKILLTCIPEPRS